MHYKVCCANNQVNYHLEFCFPHQFLMPAILQLHHNIFASCFVSLSILTVLLLFLHFVIHLYHLCLCESLSNNNAFVSWNSVNNQLVLLLQFISFFICGCLQWGYVWLLTMGLSVAAYNGAWALITVVWADLLQNFVGVNYFYCILLLLVQHSSLEQILFPVAFDCLPFYCPLI